MGGGNHSCCKTTMNTSQTVAAASQRLQVQLPPVMVAVGSSCNISIADVAAQGVYIAHSFVPISPPRSQPILRI
jgi:hypothetical protein